LEWIGVGVYEICNRSSWFRQIRVVLEGVKTSFTLSSSVPRIPEEEGSSRSRWRTAPPCCEIRRPAQVGDEG
jgi:hypothetical protein